MKDGGIMKNTITSKNLTDLGNKLIEIILKRNDPFTTIKVVTSSLSVQQWFKAYWLSNQDEILMNVEFVNINDALLSLIDTDDTKYKIINKDTYKSLIIKHLFDEDVKDKLEENIRDYLFKDNQVDPIKLYDFADALASLFVEYDNENNLEKTLINKSTTVSENSNDTFKISGWQKKIYNLVVKDAIKDNQAPLSYIYANKFGFNKVQNMYFLGFFEFKKLHKLIIDEYSSEFEITSFELETISKSEEVTSYSVFTAPSPLREIETIHSKICEHIKNNDCHYSDFLVLAPDVSVYENIIPLVFNQSDKYPNIPYSINDRKKISSNVNLGIHKLFEIFSKKFYTRYDFFELINNPDIKKSRHLTDDDIDAFCDCILAMNVYRNKDTFDDWNYAKNRLLMSKIASINDIDNIVNLNDGSYLPYSTIDLNNDAIVKFSSIIEDISLWCNTINDINKIDNNDIDALIEQLSKWFSIKDKYDVETNVFFKKIVNVLESWKKFEVSNKNVPLNTLFYYMFDLSKVTSVKTGDFFTRGVTFADFNSEAVVASKYVFFLNAGSKELPQVVIKQEIDKRPGPIYDIKKINDAFLTQAYNASNHFYVSYINRNLKTDEELFPSTFIIDFIERKLITEKNGEKIYDIENISIDETRKWSELYTSRSYKNKKYYDGLLDENNVSENKKTKIDIKYAFLKKVNLKDMANFLEEPLMYKAKFLFGGSDETDEKMRKEYEPFDLDTLTSSVLMKKVITIMLQSPTDLTEKEKENLKGQFILTHQLPDMSKKITDNAFDELVRKASEVKELVKNVEGNFEFITFEDIQFKTNEHNWILTSNQTYCKIVNDTKITYIQLKENLKSGKKESKESEEDTLKKFLELYIVSLIDIVLLNDENEHDIYLIRSPKHSKSYKLTSKRAKEILDGIYEEMNDYDSNIFLATKLLKNCKVNSIYSLIDLINDEHGPWAYFKDKDFFDLQTQLGYTADSFKKNDEDPQSKNEFEMAIEKQANLIEFIEKPKKGEAQ